jgi:hypothetical protein
MSAEAAPQATRQAAHLAALPAIPVIDRIAGNPRWECDSAPAIPPRSQRHKQVNP